MISMVSVISVELLAGSKSDQYDHHGVLWFHVPDQHLKNSQVITDRVDHHQVQYPTCKPCPHQVKLGVSL